MPEPRPCPFVYAEVAINCLEYLMVELHHIAGASLHATRAPHHTPLALLNGQFFAESFLKLLEVVEALSGFQMRHLAPCAGIVSPSGGSVIGLSTLSRPDRPNRRSWPLTYRSMEMAASLPDAKAAASEP
jgi:hypothetical protein